MKGVYIVQLRQQDFSYNGKDLAIWTAVETATAIIAASIPVLRVFLKETVKSYSSSRDRSHVNSAKSTPLSRIRQSHLSSHTAAVQAMGRDKNDGWISMMPADDVSPDNASQRAILRHDEEYLERGDAGVVVHDNHGIMQTNTVSVTVGPRPDNTPWSRSP